MEYAESPVFSSIGASYSQWSNTACVVVNGAANTYFDRGSELPAILFSWADPALAMQGVKLIFDDAPWALAVRAVKELMSGEEEISLPSEIIVLSGNIRDKELSAKLKALTREEPAEEELPPEG